MLDDAADRDQADPASEERFRAVYGRPPTERELARLAETRTLLLMGIPARARRRTARVLCRL